MMYWDGDGHGGGWVVGMVLMMVLFWGSILTLIWVGIRALVQHPKAAAEEHVPAQQILAQRLARGEIEPEEYQKRLEALGGAR